MELIFFVLGIVLLILFLFYCKNSRQPIKYSIANMLSGIATLTALAIISGDIAVNYVTCFTALVLGVPGVIMIAVFGILK